MTSQSEGRIRKHLNCRTNTARGSNAHSAKGRVSVNVILLHRSSGDALYYTKHRVLMNNYPVTAVGFLDAGQQFNLVMLAVSN
jgi:hypothetical protein